MKTLNQLYKLLKDNYNHEEEEFICNTMFTMKTRGIITIEEQVKLINHFESNKPNEKRYTKFYNHKSFIGGFAWWDFSEEKQRILFIDKMIKITKLKKHLVN